MHGCGTGCAMNYEVLKYEKSDSAYLIDFMVEMSVYEIIEDTFEIQYNLYCQDNESVYLLSTDGDNQNMYDVYVNNANVSFKKFGDDFCSCVYKNNNRENLNISNKASSEQIVKKKCYEINDEKNYVFTDICEYEKMNDVKYLYKQIIEKYSNELLNELPLKDTIYSTSSIPEIEYLIKKDTIKIIKTSEGGETIFKIYTNNKNGVIAIEKSPW
jgi:hypothetical protein